MKNLLVLVFLAVCAAACSDKSEKVRLYTPDEYAPRFQPQRSTVPFPLFVSFEELETLINGALPELVLDDSLYNGGEVDNAKIQLRRTGAVKLRKSGDRMHLSVPLEVNVQPLIAKKILGVNVSASPKMQAAFYLNMTSSVDFNSEYQIISDLKIDKIEWIESPSMRLLIFDVPITKTVEKILNEKGALLENGLNRAVSKSVNVRKPVAKIWRDIHKPIRINKKYELAYLITEPQDLHLGKIEILEEGLVAWLELGALVQTSIGNDTSLAQVSPLPKLQRSDSLNTNFALHFFVEIPLKKVGTLLEQEFAKKNIPVEGSNLYIERLSLHTSPEKLQVEVGISDPAEAALRFEGAVLFDPADTTIGAREFDFYLMDGNTATYAADAILHDLVLEALGEEFRLPLGSLINQIGPIVEGAIEKGKLGEKIRVGLSDVHLAPTRIALRPDTILIDVLGTGRANLDILKLRAKNKAP